MEMIMKANITGHTTTYKSPRTWGKASVTVIDNKCMVVTDRGRTAVVINDNWEALIEVLGDLPSNTESTQVGPCLSTNLHLRAEYCPPESGHKEGLILRMGKIAILLRMYDAMRLLALLKKGVRLLP